MAKDVLETWGGLRYRGLSDYFLILSTKKWKGVYSTNYTVDHRRHRSVNCSNFHVAQGINNAGMASAHALGPLICNTVHRQASSAPPGPLLNPTIWKIPRRVFFPPLTLQCEIWAGKRYGLNFDHIPPLLTVLRSSLLGPGGSQYVQVCAIQENYEWWKGSPVIFNWFLLHVCTKRKQPIVGFHYNIGKAHLEELQRLIEYFRQYRFGPPKFVLKVAPTTINAKKK